VQATKQNTEPIENFNAKRQNPKHLLSNCHVIRGSDLSIPMDLFATGFNAWNQLSVAQKILPHEPHDLFAFTKVLSASAIERPVSRLTYTIGTYIIT
jgi:hypothetical protein